ncbi:MAG: beta-ketoacyl-[acyl-carrier-protein] synthase II, partial [Acidobacteriota bacterium]|nr:beta-ketoacyl-[acyl-carrier-protein] synthase II [Acidobacteriota bacterium]
MGRRVVITGVGIISPVGLTRERTWDALLAGKSGIGPITCFDAADYACRIAGEVRGFDCLDFLDRKEARKMDRFSHFALAAAGEALQDADLTIDASNEERIGVYIGSGIGGLPLLEQQHRTLLERGPRRMS